MRIWIDGQCLQTASRHRGIGRYVLGLIGGIVKQPDARIEVSLNAAFPETLLSAREALSDFVPRESVHVWQGLSEGGEAGYGLSEARRASELALAYHVGCLGPDVALSPSPFEGLHDQATPLISVRPQGTAFACVAYDFIPHFYPEHFLGSHELRLAYERRLRALLSSPTVLTISAFTRLSLEKLGYAGRSVSIDAGLDSRIIALAGRAAPTPQPDGEQYLLYVGSLDWHKNVRLIVDAIALIPNAMRSRLVFRLAGSEHAPHQDEIQSRWEELGMPSELISFEGQVSDEKLVDLFRGAAALVHPSHMEGFGLTVLEAMQCGTPVVCSTAGALIEVVGDAALTFAPDSPQELADALMRLFTDPELGEQLRSKGRERAPRFTWQRTAELVTSALAESASEEQAPVADIQQLRRHAVESLATIKLPRDQKVRLMALAEPTQPAPRQLVIDATSTLTSDARTGIQRVVKSISSELAGTRLSPQTERAAVAFASGDDGWYRVDLKEDFYGSLLEKREERRVHFRNGDVLLLLDSSWEYSRPHRAMARRARLRGTTVVSCLYDLVPLKSYAFCDSGMPVAFSAWFSACLTYSDAFVCISRAVADELYGMLEAIRFPYKIGIGYWHLGADFVGAPAVSAAAVQTGRMRFLMVGTVEPRKGHRLALEACSLLWKAGEDFDLVIAGKPGWNTESLVAAMTSNPEYGKRLHWHDKLDDRELGNLYASCDALIAASFAEGFGLPIVEAGQYGRPVIASDIPVFREVAGETGALFFSVGSAESLAASMRDFIKTPVRRPLPPVGGRLSWRDSALELQRIVLDGDWYRTYRPETAANRPLRSAFDLVEMKAPLLENERNCSLTLVSGPVPSRDRDAQHYVVRVTNLSRRVWSSHGRDDGLFSVRLGYATATLRDGRLVPVAEPFRTAIPFALSPGESHYMPLEVPMRSLPADAEFVDVQLVQEGVGQFGGPLRVPLR